MTSSSRLLFSLSGDRRNISNMLRKWRYCCKNSSLYESGSRFIKFCNCGKLSGNWLLCLMLRRWLPCRDHTFYCDVTTHRFELLNYFQDPKFKTHGTRVKCKCQKKNGSVGLWHLLLRLVDRMVTFNAAMMKFVTKICELKLRKNHHLQQWR